MSELIKNFPLIFEEGPIARSYLQLFRSMGMRNIKILYLLNNKFFIKKFSYFIQFKKNLHYPLKFIKDKKIINLILQFQEFFNFERNFLFDMYNERNIYENNKFIFINSDNINSNIFVDTLKNLKENIFINSSKQIFKNFTHGKNIIHIHPGYLPKVRGADGSLVSILKYDELGITSFFISRSIDKGQIIKREINIFKPFKFDISDYSVEDIYRIWYSFFDPLLRCFHLKKLILEKTNIIPKNNSCEFSDEDSNYYTFLSTSNYKNVFKKIFYK